MNFTDYETKYFVIYSEFAETIRFIFQEALRSSGELHLTQSIQYRAKDVESLRLRLLQANQLDTNTLEIDRKDLAGVRLIFYTNNGVEKFCQSSLISENFEVEYDSTKVHHPTQENEGAKYRAIHYTVRLREERLRLPEYARFADLRCEVQIQTVLNHAWSETSHDIVYKTNLGKGFGAKAMQGIKQRFDRIMDQYLIPAGFEIQKAQQDYDRLIQGKELYDKDIAVLLDNAQNNNERYEILSGLKDYAIPHYDDLQAAYKGLKDPLLRAVKAARVTEPSPIETTYGPMAGFKSETVILIVIEIVESLRRMDVVGTLQILIDIFRDEPEDDLRKKILSSVKNLSEYNIEAYQQVGPALQMALIDHLAGMQNAELDSIRPLAIIVWSEALQSDITGTNWTPDSVVFKTGAVPVSDQFREVRNKAMNALFAAYDRSVDDSQKREVLHALGAAGRTPSQAQYSNGLLEITLKDAARIVEFMFSHVSTASYEILQHFEHKLLYDCFRAQALINDATNRFDCKAEAEALVSAIFKFRESVNADVGFVRYKVLVGFESVFPADWEDREFRIRKHDEYRRVEADRYIDEISQENEPDWFSLISRCAETKSTDLATFPIFGKFISNLAERRPEIACRLFKNATDDLHRFIPGFLNGLAVSGREDVYERELEAEFLSARNLAGLAKHVRYSPIHKPQFFDRLVTKSIEAEDSASVIECLLFSLEEYGTNKFTDHDAVLCRALKYLNTMKDPRWVVDAWFLRNTAKCFEGMSEDSVAQILQSLGFLQTIDYQAEQILVHLAERRREWVWDFFGDRLAIESTRDSDDFSFEAIPFRFHSLDAELSKSPELAVSKGLSWFLKDRDLFRFRGGRLLSIVFPDFNGEFSTALGQSLKDGGDTEAEFVLEILQNYEGETVVHSVLKEIVARFPDDEDKMNAVRVCIDSTGVVTGELGYAEALRARKESLAEWSSDERLPVRLFVEKHEKELDRMIASEYRRAETAKEMRVRSFAASSAPSDD